MTSARLLPRLRHRLDLRTLVFVGLELVLIAGTWSGGWRHPAAVAASFGFAFVCCIIAHNHMHLPLFRGRGWNRWFQVLLMFGSGQPPTGIVTAHNERHHGQPDSERDFVRTSLARFRWNALNLVAFPFLSIAAMYREKPDDLRHLQHQDCDTGSEYHHSRNVTGRLVNWLLLNNGYYTAHHVRQSMPIVPLAPMEPAVEIRHLVKEFRPAGRKLPLRAVDDVSLTIGAGEVYALIGPNGSGKSTFWSMRCPRSRNRNCAPSSISPCPEKGSSR